MAGSAKVEVLRGRSELVEPLLEVSRYLLHISVTACKAHAVP